jgi:ferritin-like metal-binding protein YciE
MSGCPSDAARPPRVQGRPNNHFKMNPHQNGHAVFVRCDGTMVALSLLPSDGTGMALSCSSEPNTRIASRQARRIVMETESLQDLFVEELKDLYSAENQILKAGPKMVKAIENEDLRSAIQDHLKVTEKQVERLERIFKKLGEKPTGKKCHGMEGLLEENKELLSEDAEQEVLEAGLIVGQQKVEHYEIAGYGSVVTFAKLLGDDESARLLAQTLEEEKTADQMLTEIAESTINVEAQQQA